jgi:hypothetical protein
MGKVTLQPRQVQSTDERRVGKHRALNARRAAHTVRFAAVDSEAPGNEPDRIVLMRVGDNSFEYDDAKWYEIFRDLYSCFKPDTCYTGFYLGYDFTQWLKSLPAGRAYTLFYPDGIKESSADGRWLYDVDDMRKTPGEWIFPPRTRTRSGGNKVPFPVQCRDPETGRDWQFDILGMKRLKLRPKFCDCISSACEHQEKIPWMYVCDSGPFFQTTFLAAINPDDWDNPIVSPEDYATIKEGKDKRDSAQLDDEMRNYNELECIVHARLMTRFNEGLVRGANIRLSKDKWFGPGQASQNWMQQQKYLPSSETLRLAAENGNPELFDFERIAKLSYVAGWFEIFVHGILPGITYEYDINSAYPHIISRLPCLIHARITSGKGKPPSELEPDSWITGGPVRLVHAKVIGVRSKHIGPMPYRNDRGGVSRPQECSGWFWQHEIDASRRAGLTRYVTYDEWTQLTPGQCPEGCDAFPMQKVAELYSYRLSISKDSAEGKAIKKVLASIYGKFAQSVGQPIYGCGIYASLITSGTRTMILNAIATHPDKSGAVTMVATDAVYFRRRHPTLASETKELGEWEEKEKVDLTQFKPGVYWDRDARERIAAGKDPELHSRGVQASDMAKIIASADDDYKAWRPGHTPFPSLPLTVGFTMTTLQQALQGRGGSSWHKAGRISHDEIGTQDSNPHEKRWAIGLTYDKKYDMYRSKMYAKGVSGIESTPYERTFGWPDDDENAFGVNPDGPTWLVFRKAVLGG